MLNQINPNVGAVFLKDPPWFLGRPRDWGRSIFSKLFSTLLLRLTWQQEFPPFTTVGFLPVDQPAGEVSPGTKFRLGFCSATPPHYSLVDPCCLRIEAGRTSSSSIAADLNARHRGTEWWSTASDAGFAGPAEASALSPLPRIAHRPPGFFSWARPNWPGAAGTGLAFELPK